MSRRAKMIIWRPMAQLPVWSDALENTYYVFWNACDDGCRLVHTGFDAAVAKRDWPGFRAGYDAWAILPVPEFVEKAAA